MSSYKDFGLLEASDGLAKTAKYLIPLQGMQASHSLSKHSEC